MALFTIGWANCYANTPIQAGEQADERDQRPDGKDSELAE
jgi:hypothetical protein